MATNLMNDRSIAYFSMEIALDSRIPTYAGGLGVLAGDTIRSAADLNVPMLAVTLLHRKGYLEQHLDPSGWQRESPVEWAPEQFLTELPNRVEVAIENRKVQIRPWRYDIKGITDFAVPVFLLDTDLPGNSEWDRTLTHYLYGGDQYYRLCQEIVLGIGGVKMLRALGYQHLARFHMNEGHAALLALELLEEQARKGGRSGANREDIEAVRQMCIFTTHTPVPAGHDQFPMELVGRVLVSHGEFIDMRDIFCVDLVKQVFGNHREFATLHQAAQSGSMLNMTYLALNLSHYVNGVAKKHQEVSRLMFAGYNIDEITNGVHAGTWTSPPFQELFDKHIPGWRQDNFSLRFAHDLPPDELRSAHEKAKLTLFAAIKERTGSSFNPELFTIGFARRATPYKRMDMLFHDPERLKRIAKEKGPIQLLFGGKAHPNDSAGKEAIQRVIRVRESLLPEISLVYLQNYDVELAKLLVAGVDLWLNTPQVPLEASGTSGMKAALNGVPSFSTLDGWWVEGWIEGETGWAIGEKCTQTDPAERLTCELASLYDKLDNLILPMFYHDRAAYLGVMCHSISLNGSFFNTQRMIQQYVLKAYFE